MQAGVVEELVPQRSRIPQGSAQVAGTTSCMPSHAAGRWSRAEATNGGRSCASSGAIFRPGAAACARSWPPTAWAGRRRQQTSAAR